MPRSKEWPCRHDKERKKLPGGKVHCGLCGRTFTSPKSQIRHGTNRGYQRHKRQRKGDWDWPALVGTCGCKEANKEYSKHIRDLPENVAVRHIRDASRQAALLHLRRQFPSEYLGHYSAEVTARTLGLPYQLPAGDGVPLPQWDDLMARLVKEALGSDEAEIRTRMRGGWVPPRERTVIQLATRLRYLLASADRVKK